MLSERFADSQCVWAPAKVNLFLEIRAKRPDGYHDLATLMVAVSLFDSLACTPDHPGRFSLRCSDPTLSTGPDNLVCRAADVLRTRTGCDRGAALWLIKRIPQAAGLAGGSSDAAAALQGLNRLWQLGLTRRQLADLGAEVGSDVAFFFATPAAWCTGRGEQTHSIELGRPLWFVLVWPPVGLSTAEVFRNVTVPTDPLDGADLVRAVAAGAVDEIGRRLHNRLQPVAERLCPAVAELHRIMQDTPAVGRLMSGSGTCSFALCRDRAEAGRVARDVARAVNQLASSGPRARVAIVRSCF